MFILVRTFSCSSQVGDTIYVRVTIQQQPSQKEKEEVCGFEDSVQQVAIGFCSQANMYLDWNCDSEQSNSSRAKKEKEGSLE